ncbi:TB2/DP1, HVA22 family [Ancylostoma duodenale]|uniref:Receptor expression-enhancing protein n=1 Tax=Ancylostoma duodenale TaxID=51022 RepID=A0A0C2CGH4_9BILA|nr:TB2/DP1, HVA22 family [Ancylostoma duodenale]
MSVVLSRIVTLTAGTLYPAYRSYKAVRTKDVREYVKWMMYWIVFAIYTFVETLADIFISFWFPFYYQLKIVFVIWLLSPWTKGASILYRKWIHPTLSKHEQDIDALLEQAKSESYNQLVRLGSRSLLCARDIVAEAALRGQAQLVNQLQRSYSANDVNREREEDSRKRIHVEGIEELEDETSDHERSGERQSVAEAALRGQAQLVNQLQRSYSANDVNREREEDSRKRIHVEGIEELEDETSDHERSGERQSGDDEMPRRRANRSRSRSRPLEGGENTYNTMPRRSTRRHM